MDDFDFDFDPSLRGSVKSIGHALRFLLTYCRKYLGVILAAVVFAAVSAVLSVIGPDYISKLTETITSGVSAAGIRIDMARIARIGMTLIGLYAVSSLLSYLQAVIMNRVSCEVGRKMRTDISEKINRIPLKYFDSHNNGDTLSRVTNDVDSVSMSLNMSIGTLVTAVTTLVGSVVMMFLTEWRMALTAIASPLVGFAGMTLIMGRSQRHFVARQKSLAKVNAHVEEYYAGQSIVRAYNAEAQGLAAFREANETLRRHSFSAEFFGSLMMPIMSFVGNFGYVAVCIVGAALAFSGSISFAVVVAFMIYVRLFTSPISQIGGEFSSLQSAAAAGERVSEFLAEPELSDESGKPDAAGGVRGDVTFDHIRFGYDPDKTIIHDFSANIKAGQKVAIVGPTGAGKTTIVNLLMRFYELEQGTISVDGVSTADMTRQTVHGMFGMVLQDTWLFEGTLRENLTYGRKDVSDERLLDICRQCSLEHFVGALPDGLDTVLSEKVSISAGQKQLLTIARAMVEDAPMLILDEATSSVDTRTELKIQQAMDALTAGRTSFVIAHRLSTIKDADLILYMQDGDIKETGTHEELLAKQGYYAELYNSQFAA